MATNHSVENKVAGKQYPAGEPNPENTIQERLMALELQLKIFKQAESIGEIGNWQINLNTFETWYSDNVFRIYGLEPYTVNSRPDTFHDFLHEDDRAVVLTALERSYAEKVPLHLEFRIRRLDGQERHINVVSSVTKNHIGEPLLTGITQDITDRKNLEIQLREYGEKIHLQNELFRHAEQIGLFGTRRKPQHQANSLFRKLFSHFWIEANRLISRAGRIYSFHSSRRSISIQRIN
jgi:PAS domain S-box-containing protein